MDISTEEAIMLAETMVDITSDQELEVSAVSVATTLIENLTQAAIQQPEV